MANLQQLEFFLLRYVGDATKGESINLGVVAIGSEHGPSGGFADVRFIRNWRRLHCFDPLADTDEVQAIEREIRRDLQDTQRRAELIKRTLDSWSNLVRCEPLQGCLSESPAKELEKLSSLYLETSVPGEKRDLSGRQRILAHIKDELERTGVLPLMLRDISMAEYGQFESLPNVDFGYPAREAFKFLQAVSLRQRVNTGVIWARRFPEVAVGIEHKTGAKAWMTAVVDDDLPRGDEVAITLDLMRESGIVIAHMADMSRIAEGIRLELKIKP